VQDRRGNAKGTPFGPRQPGTAGADEPHVDEGVVHAGVRSTDQMENDGPSSAASR